MNEFETAWNEAAFFSEADESHLPRITPGIVGTFQAYLHYLDESGTDRTYRLEDISLHRLDLREDKGFVNALEELRGKEGTHDFTGSYSYNTYNSILFHITLIVKGTITSSKKGWVFRGKVTAEPDKYDFHKGDRGILGEIATAIGRIGGEMSGAEEYMIYITGEVQISEYGRW